MSGIEMGRIVRIGVQSFEETRKNQYFYVDKTRFIKEWWGRCAVSTLIMRPHKFGKTLNMSMLECFFSNQYAGRSDLFEGLSIWEDEKYRNLQGTYPVISLSFADVDAEDYESARAQICREIYREYEKHRYLIEGDVLNEWDKKDYWKASPEMDTVDTAYSIRALCRLLKRYHGKNVIVLLDEYDAPMRAAYLHGYWDKLISLFRSMLIATFKSNEYLERGILMGVTRMSKESIFSDLNNLDVITTMSKKYDDCFGFTEPEVFAALDEMGLSEEKEAVRAWYHGYTFGEHTDIYNPWSITNYLKKGRFQTYWADSISSGLIGHLLISADEYKKKELENLMKGGAFEEELDEEIVFSQLDYSTDALWSFLLASGLLRVASYRCDSWSYQIIHTLTLANHEVTRMLRRMIRGWFLPAEESFNQFIEALLAGNLEKMNLCINAVAQATYSSFDTGNHPSGKAEPERFYHGFVLGLLVELRTRYAVNSNRESGYGRYDVMLEPLKQGDPAFILEFKVHNPNKESDLEATVAAALQQIKDRNYAAALEAKGIPADQIRSYGFAFEGKKVLIGC